MMAISKQPTGCGKERLCLCWTTARSRKICYLGNRGLRIYIKYILAEAFFKMKIKTLYKMVT